MFDQKSDSFLPFSENTFLSTFLVKFDSLTHFHSRNVYFYIHYSNSLNVTALDMLKKKNGFTPPLNDIVLFFFFFPFFPFFFKFSNSLLLSFR